jgi:hypothetical protein
MMKPCDPVFWKAVQDVENIEFRLKDGNVLSVDGPELHGEDAFYVFILTIVEDRIQDFVYERKYRFIPNKQMAEFYAYHRAKKIWEANKGSVIINPQLVKQLTA